MRKEGTQTQSLPSEIQTVLIHLQPNSSGLTTVITKHSVCKMSFVYQNCDVSVINLKRFVKTISIIFLNCKIVYVSDHTIGCFKDKTFSLPFICRFCCESLYKISVFLFMKTMKMKSPRNFKQFHTSTYL